MMTNDNVVHHLVAMSPTTWQPDFICVVVSWCGGQTHVVVWWADTCRGGGRTHIVVWCTHAWLPRCRWQRRGTWLWWLATDKGWGGLTWAKTMKENHSSSGCHVTNSDVAPWALSCRRWAWPCHWCCCMVWPWVISWPWGCVVAMVFWL